MERAFQAKSEEFTTESDPGQLVSLYSSASFCQDRLTQFVMGSGCEKNYIRPGW